MINSFQKKIYHFAEQFLFLLYSVCIFPHNSTPKLNLCVLNFFQQFNGQNSDGTSQPIYLENLNGYWGCAIDGTSNKLPATIMLIVNPDHPDISFYIWINYSKEYYHDAIAILKSFTPM
jgi:hypothetical protein